MWVNLYGTFERRPGKARRAWKRNRGAPAGRPDQVSRTMGSGQKKTGSWYAPYTPSMACRISYRVA
jgi:hypothetical protein